MLSKGGMLALVKSTMTNIPIYYMSLLIMPISVAKILEAVQYRFSCDLEKQIKHHLVASEEIKQPILQGGLV